MSSKQLSEWKVCYYGNEMQKYVFFAVMHYMYEGCLGSLRTFAII